jgi:hypothetical protein
MRSQGFYQAMQWKNTSARSYAKKIEKPLKFQWLSPSAQSSVEVFGYDPFLKRPQHKPLICDYKWTTMSAIIHQ